MFDAAHIELWIGFAVIVVVLLGLDLAVFNRKAHAVTIRESLIWSIVWICLSLLFCGGIWWLLGPKPAGEYLTGYVIEKSLSVDNLFVFLVIFQYFQVDAKYQHRVLFWGVFGAILLRALMIFVGAALVARFHWILYGFGGFLVFTAVKMALSKDKKMDPGQTRAVRLVRRFFPVTDKLHGQSFFIRENGRRFATPLLLVLITVEVSDVIFAVDSIPAIFGITQDPFVVLTSNIFAILGLRALYFLLAGIMDRFHYLQYGLSAVLGFIGVKMLIEPWVHIDTFVSLGVVFGLLALSVLASLLRPAPTGEQPS